MQDRALLVLIGVLVVSMIFRLLMMSEVRRWSPEQTARLLHAFYRQHKITTAVLIAAMLLLVIPSFIGGQSIAIAFASTLLACVVTAMSGLWSNLKLRRLSFPARYVLLHAAQTTVVAAGLVAYTLLLLLG